MWSPAESPAASATGRDKPVPYDPFAKACRTPDLDPPIRPGARQICGGPQGRPLWSPAESPAASATGRDKPRPLRSVRQGLPHTRSRSADQAGCTTDLRRAAGATLVVARRISRRLRDGTGQARPLRSVRQGLPHTRSRSADQAGCTTDLRRAVGATLVVARRISRRLRDGTGQARPLRSVRQGLPHTRSRSADQAGCTTDLRRAVGATLGVARRISRRLRDGTGQARPLRSVRQGLPHTRSRSADQAGCTTDLRRAVGATLGVARRISRRLRDGTGQARPLRSVRQGLPHTRSRSADQAGCTTDLRRAVGATLVVARRISRRLRDGTGQARPLRSVRQGLSYTRSGPPQPIRGPYRVN